MNKFAIKLIKGQNKHLQSQRNSQRSKTQTLQTMPRSERTIELFKHINELSPYAVHHQQNELEIKMENICKLHMNLKQYASTLRFRTEHLQKRKSIGQRQMQMITKIKQDKKFNRTFRSEIKQMQKNVQQKQEERQFAQQMIGNIKNDRKIFKNMRQRFQYKIKLFQNSLIRKNNRLKDLLKDYRLGNRKVQKIFDSKQQEKNLYTDRQREISKFLKINKRDYYQFARPNSTKLINLNDYTAKPGAWLTPDKNSKKKSFNYVNNYLIKHSKLNITKAKLSF